MCSSFSPIQPKFSGASFLSKASDASFASSQVALATAQKRSSDYALSAAKVDYELKTKILRGERESLEAEKCELIREQNILKHKYEVLKLEKESEQKSLIEYRKSLDERMSVIFQSTDSIDTLHKDIDQLNNEVIQKQRDIFGLEKVKSELTCRVAELEASLQAKSERLNYLETFVEQNKVELEEYSNMRDQIQKLIMEKAELETRLKLELNHTELPKGFDRYVKGGSSYVAKLEMEHDRLKQAFKELSQERATWLVTKEENIDLCSQVELLKQWRQRALIAENMLHEKETLLNDKLCTTVNSVHSSVVQRLERENEILLFEQGELTSKVRELSKIIEEQRVELTKSNVNLQMLQPQYEALKQTYARDARHIQLITKEKELFASLFETLNLSKSDDGSPLTADQLKSIYSLQSDLRDFLSTCQAENSVQNKRLDNLLLTAEKQLKLYNNCSSVLTQNADTAETTSKTESITHLRHQITELEEQVQKLLDKNTDLEDKLDVYNMKGCYDSNRTKILTFQANPSEAAKENLSNEVIELRHLNERQRQRIQVLEERVIRLSEHRSNCDRTMDEATMVLDVTSAVNERLQDNPDPLTELADVKEKLRIERLRGDRMMELFDKASAKFRGACRQLLGFRVDVQPSGRCKIRPVLNNDANDCFVFEKTDDNFELVESPFTKSLPDHIRSYLDQNHSIPGFLASVTLYYIQQNTMLT